MEEYSIHDIIHALDKHIEYTGKQDLRAPEANQHLDGKGILNDRPDRSGLPLRRKLRKGLIPHAYQDGATWIIPHSSNNGKRK